MKNETLSHIIEWIARGVELTGIAIVVLGTLIALGRYLFRSRFGEKSYEVLRREVGKSILLGLEFLVAGDIIATVVIEPTMNSVLILGLIVIIRTFLSFSLEVELEGRWPWQGKGKGKEHVKSN